MPQMMPTDIQKSFERRGWAKRAGGDLYFNGFGTSAHPHLHLQIASMRGGTRPREGGDIRLAVCMLAFSEGPGGRRGKTFISNHGEKVHSDWKYKARDATTMNGETRDEMAWILDYFTAG